MMLDYSDMTLYNIYVTLRKNHDIFTIFSLFILLFMILKTRTQQITIVLLYLVCVCYFLRH